MLNGIEYAVAREAGSIFGSAILVASTWKLAAQRATSSKDMWLFAGGFRLIAAAQTAGVLSVVVGAFLITHPVALWGSVAVIITVSGYVHLLTPLPPRYTTEDGTRNLHNPLNE